jgi:cytochrome P450
MSFPPGPRGRLANTIALTRHPLDAPPEWLTRYGDPFTVRAVNGDVVMTADPVHIKTLFGADPELFEAFAAHAVAPVTGPDSLLVLSGARHRQERRLLMPPFHGDRMRAYAQLMADAAAQRLAAADRKAAFNLQGVTQGLSLDVILRAVLGLPLDAVGDFRQRVLDTVDGVSPLMLFFPFLQRGFFGMSPWDRFQARFAELDAELQAHIERVRAAGPGEDILSLMLAARYEDGEPMPDSAIRDELRTLVIAGHETTALSLAWAIDALHRHPAALARLQAEVDAAPDDPAAWAELPYLDAVCKETLRLYPILTEVLRTLVRPWHFAGYDLPAGATVSASIHLTHRRPDLYPEPEAFRPERFLERKFSPFEYLPFGGGHRRCLGAAFAHFEMKVVLAYALRTYRFRLTSTQAPRPVRRNLTLAPEGGVWVELTTAPSVGTA